MVKRSMEICGNLELCRGFIFLGRFDFFQAGAKC